jgi:hypothetical protein
MSFWHFIKIAVRHLLPLLTAEKFGKPYSGESETGLSELFQTFESCSIEQKTDDLLRHES